jgi:hypothetical protein
MQMRRVRTLAAGASLFGSLVLAAVAFPAVAAGGDVRVSVGSPATPFSQSKQNEPALAVDQNHPQILVAGANDEIDEEACNAGSDTDCPFTPGIGVSGVYFSFNAGRSWTQPTYTGLTARGCLGKVGDTDPTCTPEVGPIGTLPWYYEHGLVSDGDPAVAFGPAPGSNGRFSWSNGDRLYYANLTSNLNSNPSEAGFKGVEGIGISRTDNVRAAASGVKGAWMSPVVVPASISAAAFADKDQIWADNASSSPHFGNVYLCFGNFKGGHSAASNSEALVVARSTDGGSTWTKQTLVKNTSSSSGKFSLISGQTGCTIRTSSDGTVYIFWLGFSKTTDTQGIYMASSTNGGVSYSAPSRLFTTQAVGLFDPVIGRNTEDGIAGARDDLANGPNVDIANGAPNGTDATNQIVMTWTDGKFGLNHEPVLFSTSTNGGNTWTSPLKIDGTGVPTNRAYYTAPAISPNGTDVYVAYNAWLQPYQTNTSHPRLLVGRVAHADISASGKVGTFSRIHSSAAGDARGSSQNDLTAEFLGDYVYAVATRTYGSAVWNDVRGAADCPAIDRWRLSLRTGASVAVPAPQQDCPNSFGNSDIFGGSYPDPTP